MGRLKLILRHLDCSDEEAGSRAEQDDDLKQLSVRELKGLLTTRGIPHGDCIEKSDLVRKIKEWLPHTVALSPINEQHDSEQIDIKLEAQLIAEIGSIDDQSRKSAEKRLLEAGRQTSVQNPKQNCCMLRGWCQTKRRVWQSPFSRA